MDNRKRRKTIGLLIDWASEYQMKIVFGAVDAAKNHDVNLIVIEGGCLGSNRLHDDQRNMLYQMVKTNDIDGIIVISPGVSHFSGPGPLIDLLKQYDPLPIVSIAHEIEGCGLIALDNAPGLKELLQHLIEFHKYRRFAMITGPRDNQDTRIRLDITRQTLADYGYHIDERFIVTGDYSQQSGADAVQTLFEQKDAAFDVIIAINDEMALGAIQQLQALSVRVPQDIAVVGFDNIEKSAYFEPSLTTVNQSLYEQGFRSVNMVLSMINGEEKTNRFEEPTRMVIRESCGCFSRAMEITDDLYWPEKANDDICNRKIEELTDHIMEKMDLPETKFSSLDLKYITERFIGALKCYWHDLNKIEFQKICYELFHKKLHSDEDVILCHRLISEIRYCLMSSLHSSTDMMHLEDMLHFTRVMIGEEAIGQQQAGYQETLQSNSIFNSINESLFSVSDVNRMVEVLAKRLPLMGITTCFLDQFTGEPIWNGERRLTLGYNKQGHIDGEAARPYAGRLVPDEVFQDEECHAIMVTLLQFSEMKFGFIGTEINLHNSSLYSQLRRIICSTLYSIKVNQEKYRLAEEEHQRNLAAAKQTMEEFIRTILLTVEMRDPYTAGHQSKVADIANAIAVEMELPPETVEGIRMAGIVHDLGKICVPAEILNKPGKLSAAEFALIKDHPQVAYDILKNVTFPWPIAEIILQHHERLDGSGYPHGLKGDEIRLEARILCVADVVEAMAAHRPYRPALGMEEALKEIKKNRGILYHPDVVDACLKLLAWF